MLENILSADIWAGCLERGQVAITTGDPRLEFGCSQEPTPWDFIAEIAESERHANKNGDMAGLGHDR